MAAAGKKTIQQTSANDNYLQYYREPLSTYLTVHSTCAAYRGQTPMTILPSHPHARSLSALLRDLLTAIALFAVIGLSLPHFALAQQSSAAADSPLPVSNSNTLTASSPLASAELGASTLPVSPEALTAEALAASAALLAADMSPWGMFQKADAIVRGVMIGLALASVLTWTLWLSKSLELFGAKRRLQHEMSHLKLARSLPEAQRNTGGGLSLRLIEDAQDELQLSAHARCNDGIKERVNFRLERLVAASGRQMSRGTGVLATIGSTAPFVGLFGTVWGIMNSFIGIAKSQTTNIAVVAPGIAEALLATALGLVAAIPAVVIYNVFARSIAGYKAQVADASAQVLLLVSRDLDLPNPERHAAPLPVKIQPHMVKAG
jgi:biopolymer transport protein ExbB